MPDVNGLQFFKPEPYFTKGGQGKLFPDPKPIAQHRYQRGYTPERMREVKGSMLDVTSTGRGNFAGPAGIDRVYQTIARSTTPVHEFNETPVRTAWRKSGRPDHPNIDTSDMFPLHIETGHDVAKLSGIGNAAATYNAGGTWERGLARVGADTHDTEEHAGQSLLHEIGHYRSEKVENTGHQSSYGKDPAETGREEAFADDNMVTRWRPDPRDVRRGTSHPKEPSYEGGGGVFPRGYGGQKAYGPYLTARTTLTKEQKRAMRSIGGRPMRNRDLYTETSFTQPSGSQHTMDNPDTVREDRTYKPAMWNVQHPLFNHQQFFGTATGNAEEDASFRRRFPSFADGGKTVADWKEDG